MKRIIIVSALAPLLFFTLWGCDNDTSNGPVDPGGGTVPPEKSCLGCHSSEELLKASMGPVAGSKVVTQAKGGG